jgi:hypothetical protein
MHINFIIYFILILICIIIFTLYFYKTHLLKKSNNEIYILCNIVIYYSDMFILFTKERELL